MKPNPTESNLMKPNPTESNLTKVRKFGLIAPAGAPRLPLDNSFIPLIIESVPS
jgi:hypothetical protein